MLTNIPKVKLGIIAVSRDCFIISLSERRRAAVVETCGKSGIDVYECKTTVENELDMLKAVDEVNAAGCNALVVFLGNFGPETPETLIAKKFDGPVMYAAAAEETGDDLINGRGDAYCGMLNCSYNLGMRHLKAYIPEYPVGTAEDIAKMIGEFVPIARTLIGLSDLKIITFGPRPQDFFACNAPIKGLYEIGVEIEENSELDLLVSYKAHADDPRIAEICKEMAAEMGEGRYYAEMNARMAQLEITLLDINNSVPADLYKQDSEGKFPYALTDTFMGFHCGNTPECKLCEERAVKYQLIQHRLLEPKDSEPDFTRGTLEGDIAASDITFFRLQCDSEGVLRAYVAEGEVLPVKTRSFGGIGVFAIPEMGRFYRHVLIQKRYPHHGAVAFNHCGNLIFEVLKILGVEDIAYNQPKSLPYPTERPF